MSFLHSRTAWYHACIHILHDVILAFTLCMVSLLHSHTAWCHSRLQKPHLVPDDDLPWLSKLDSHFSCETLYEKKKNILIMERHRLRQTLTQSCAKEMMPRGQRASLPFYTNSGSKTRRHTRDQSRLTSGLNKNNQIIWDRYSACFSSGALEKLSKNRMYWQRKGEHRLKHS